MPDDDCIHCTSIIHALDKTREFATGRVMSKDVCVLRSHLPSTNDMICTCGQQSFTLVFTRISDVVLTLWCTASDNVPHLPIYQTLIMSKLSQRLARSPRVQQSCRARHRVKGGMPTSTKSRACPGGTTQDPKESDGA